MTIASIKLDFGGATQDQAGDVFGVVIVVERDGNRQSRQITIGSGGILPCPGNAQGLRVDKATVSQVTPHIARKAAELVDSRLAGTTFSEGLLDGNSITFSATRARKTICA